MIRVYYRNEVYEGDLENIPSPVGIVAIVIPDKRGSGNEVGRLVLHSAEYYVCINDCWFPLQTVVDLVDHVLYNKPQCVLKGRWIPDTEWDVIIKKASKDPGMPEKSGVRKLRETGLEEG